MRMNEAAMLLNWTRDELKRVIEDGIKPQGSESPLKLKAVPLRTGYDISDENLDEFINVFYKNEVKRRIPVAVRRELLVEASHRCAICMETSSLEFHHIKEYTKLKHHDPAHMIVFCATCHSRCTGGEIDQKSQYEYKIRLPRDQEIDRFPAGFSWDELKEVITTVHGDLKVKSKVAESRYDRTVIEMEEKNRLNRMGPEYFAMIRDKHQPYFGRVRQFLGNPANTEIAEKYYEIADELNSKIAAERGKFDRFEEIFLQVASRSPIRIHAGDESVSLPVCPRRIGCFKRALPNRSGTWMIYWVWMSYPLIHIGKD